VWLLTLPSGLSICIDKDEAGQPKAHFLIKRAAGVAGDHFVMERGDMKIKFAGEERWVNEREYTAARNWKHNISRIMAEEQYPALEAAGQAAAWSDLGLPVPEKLLAKASDAVNLRFPDYLAHEQARLQTLRSVVPHEKRYAMLSARHRLGWYVPEGRILPLGDNRDNSRDGRYFGPVRISKVLGRGMVIYWPLRRIGLIN
jgi:signal peptidase I